MQFFIIRYWCKDNIILSYPIAIFLTSPGKKTNKHNILVSISLISAYFIRDPEQIVLVWLYRLKDKSDRELKAYVVFQIKYNNFIKSIGLPLLKKKNEQLM